MSTVIKVGDDKNAHDPVIVPGYASSCIRPGLSDSSYCRKCQQQLTEAKELPIDPDAHNWVLGTGPAEGMDYYYCSYCGMERP